MFYFFFSQYNNVTEFVYYKWKMHVKRQDERQFFYTFFCITLRSQELLLISWSVHFTNGFSLNQFTSRFREYFTEQQGEIYVYIFQSIENSRSVSL